MKAQINHEKISNQRPVWDSIRKWHELVFKHSIHVEYYLGHDKLRKRFPSNTCSDLYMERPCDTAGAFSKLDPEVVGGLSMLFEEGGFERYSAQISAAETRNQRQLRYQVFNDPKRFANLCEYDQFFCCLESVCSLLEFGETPYAGKKSSPEATAKAIATRPKYKRIVMNEALEHITTVGLVNLEQINLAAPVNIGVPGRVYQDILTRINNSLETLKIAYQEKPSSKNTTTKREGRSSGGRVYFSFEPNRGNEYSIGLGEI